MPYILAFIFGLLSSFGALLLELFFTSFTVSNHSLIQGNAVFTPTLFSLFGRAFVEELSKIVFFLRSRHFNSLLYNSLLFGISFGTGFASLEYFTLSLLDVATTGPIMGILFIHIVTSILLVFMLRNTPSRRQILVTLGILTLIHFGYNAVL